MPKTKKTVRSWRKKFTKPDVKAALAFAGLSDWRHEVWSDGDLQFLRDGSDFGAKTTFEDLAKLHTTFMPLRMSIEAVQADNPCVMMLIVTMSWNKEPDPEAV